MRLDNILIRFVVVDDNPFIIKYNSRDKHKKHDIQILHTYLNNTPYPRKLTKMYW